MSLMLIILIYKCLLRIVTNLKLRRNAKNVFLHSGQCSNSISGNAGSKMSEEEKNKEGGKGVSVFRLSPGMAFFQLGYFAGFDPSSLIYKRLHVFPAQLPVCI